MNSDLELGDYFGRHQLSGATRAFILKNRRDEGAREVGVHAWGNVISQFASKKMGFTLQTESHSGEFAAAVHFEFNESILEIYDQVTAIKLAENNKSGKLITKDYFADYLILTINGPAVIEVKLSSWLKKIIEEGDPNWEFKNGEYIRTAAKKKFEEMGLSYYVLELSHKDYFRTENLLLLLHVRQFQSVPSKDEIKKILSVVEGAGGQLSIEELGNKTFISDYSIFAKLIEMGRLFCDLEEQLITVPNSFYVSTSSTYVDVIREQKKVENKKHSLGDTLSTFKSEKLPTEQEIKRALVSLEKINSGIVNGTTKRDKKKIREGEKVGRSPMESLLLKNKGKGNYGPKMTRKQNQVLCSFIKELEVVRIVNGVMARHYSKYCSHARKLHPDEKPVSDPTFRVYFTRLRDEVKDNYQVGGKRSSHSAESPSEVHTRSLKPTRPLQTVSIDHYLIDLWCLVVASNGVRYGARPWLSGVIDINTKKWLAFWLSFRAPSRISCAMLIRRMVRLMGRFAERVIVDRGSDFRSLYFRQLLAEIGTHLSWRPAGHSRYGAEIERLFKQLLTQWLCYRPGHVLQLNEVRSIDGSHRPDKRPVITLNNLFLEIEAFRNHYNATVSGYRDKSPDELYSEGMSKFSISGIPVNYTQEFIIKTAVDIKNYTVDPHRGINIDGRHFWHPDFVEFKYAKKKPLVRIEHEDPFRIYAKVPNKKWVVATCSGQSLSEAYDPVNKVSNAILVNQGRSIRELAKLEANIELVEMMSESDKRILDTQSIDNNIISRSDVKIEHSSSSLFASHDKSKIKQLTSKKWSTNYE